MFALHCDDGTVPEPGISLDGTNVTHDLMFRPIESSDFEQVKALHDELFPIKYGDEFFVKACQGIGIRDGRIFSSIAVQNGEIIGFVLAQLFDYYSDQVEDTDLFAFNASARKVCYIITLGVTKRLRKTGLGSILIKHCADYASADKECGAVYLHVLSTNKAAIKFYKKNLFVELRYLYDFYHFDSANHSAFLYVLYLNGAAAPYPVRVWNSTSYLWEAGYRIVASVLSLLGTTPAATEDATTISRVHTAATSVAVVDAAPPESPSSSDCSETSASAKRKAVAEQC